MDLRIIYALILTVLPISELRGGLPLAILYARDSGISVLLIFILVILLNILVIFFIFYFLDNIHSLLMKTNFYRRIFEYFFRRFQRKVSKFEKRYKTLGFLALTLFVAIPLPVTGAWTGCLLAWTLGLDRKKSILSISAGVFIAGILILFGTLGYLRFLV
jgi:uncharacterized membrane protein